MIGVNKTGFLSNWKGKVETFTATCGKCGSREVRVECDLHMGSEYTGIYGSVYLKCLECNNVEDLLS